jgi:formylglycine-generating enzyme required for sulfatase activity
VSGGTFYREYDASNDDDAGTMAAPATVGDFRLDKYEVTVGRFRAFVAAGMGTRARPPQRDAGRHPRLPESGWRAAWNAKLVGHTGGLRDGLACHGTYQTWTAAPGRGENRAVTCVTWYEALAFCAWDGGRLPTEAEWNYAASGGSQQRVYPWSVPAYASSLDDTRATFSDGSCSVNEQPPCKASNLLHVGAKPAGDGRWGQADLAGGVWEWTLDGFAAYRASCTDCAELTSTQERVVRGGSFVNTASHLRSRERGHDAPDRRDPYRGFRCARR